LARRQTSLGRRGQADSPDIAEFVQHYPDDIEFYQWLQWLAASQLAQCYQASQRHNMPIGLYRDLAVGVAEGGAETWFDPDLYCLEATIGAPPDLLGPQGQNWGLPPMDPHIMQQRAYQPFIDLLRANMAQCGALRIDHVMGLLPAPANKIFSALCHKAVRACANWRCLMPCMSICVSWI